MHKVKGLLSERWWDVWTWSAGADVAGDGVSFIVESYFFEGEG